MPMGQLGSGNSTYMPRSDFCGYVQHFRLSGGQSCLTQIVVSPIAKMGPSSFVA